MNWNTSIKELEKLKEKIKLKTIRYITKMNLKEWFIEMNEARIDNERMIRGFVRRTKIKKIYSS